MEKYKPRVFKEDEFDKDLLPQLLAYYKDGWSEVIPKEFIHHGEFKIRSHWFISIAGWLEAAKDKGLLPDNTIENVDAFLDWRIKTWSKKTSDDPNTIEDVEKGNKILTTVLDSLANNNLKNQILVSK